MSKLEAFLVKNTYLEDEFVLSDRICENGGEEADSLPLKWRIKSITQAVNEELRKKSIKHVKRDGGYITEFDHEAYLCMLAAESVVYPNLKSSDTQAAYGVMGADNLLKNMLLPGEYSMLIRKVEEINGFYKTMPELVQDAKN